MSEPSNNSVWNLINDLSQKKGITEIVINSPKRVFVERSGQFIQLNVQLTKNDIMSFANEVAAFNRKVINEEHPLLDGNLPDGSRVNIVNEPYSQGSPAVTIRKYLRHIKSFDDNPEVFGLNEKWVNFFKALVSSRSNIVVSGGTGVGKTTFLNLLLACLSSAERVVTIEDTIELQLGIPNVVRLEISQGNTTNGTQLSARDLVKNTLRMRPDRIILGEIRGGELFDLLQAMNTGHDGSMTSLHASSPAECFQRMENLFLMAGYEVPYHVVRKLVSTAVDFIIQISRDREGNRIISEIREITGMEGPNILSQVIASHVDGVLKPSGITPKNMDALHRMGGLPKDFFV
jgi:pilus assembly protein CpaF